jgi:hypothetical protein
VCIGDSYQPRSKESGPAVVGDQPISAGAIDVIFAVAQDHGGRVGDTDLPVQRKGDQGKDDGLPEGRALPTYYSMGAYNCGDVIK